MEFAKQEFDLSEKQSDGKTLKEHLENVQRITHKVPKELENLVELPECMREYWNWFLKLNNKRQPGMGIAAISYQEMKAFFELYGIYPEPNEIEVLEMFDRLAVETFSKQAEKEKARQAPKK